MQNKANGLKFEGRHKVCPYAENDSTVGAHLVCALFFFLFPIYSHAKNLDPNLPIHIQSDTASYESLTGTAVHEGNVILTQGQHTLYADKMTMKSEKKQRVIISTGKPASFEGKAENDPSPIYATAKTIYYYPDKQLVVLEGMATLKHNKDSFQGPSLSYQLDKQIISATRQSNERPTITLHPQVSQK